MKKLFVLSACALALAACSNNGGTYYGPKPQMQGQNTQQGGQQGQNGAQGQGNNTQTPPPAATLNKGDKYLALGNGPFALNDTKITVDGKEFDVAAQGDFGAVLKNAWRGYTASTGNKIGRAPADPGLEDIVVGGGDEHAIGILKPADSNSRLAFFDGNFTKEDTLPTNTVVYHTNVAVSEPGYYGFVERELTADFANKKLTGQYSDKVLLNADIKGNRFESAESAETTVKGGFFGDKAMEIGGSFQNGNLLGVFGGKQKEAMQPAAQQ